MKKIGIAFFCFQNIGQVHSYFRMRKKISHVKFTSQENIFVYLFIYLVTFTTAEKQAVVGVAQQSKAPN